MADEQPTGVSLEEAISHALAHLNEALMTGNYPEVRQWTTEVRRLRGLRT